MQRLFLAFSALRFAAALLFAMMSLVPVVMPASSALIVPAVISGASLICVVVDVNSARTVWSGVSGMTSGPWRRHRVTVMWQIVISAVVVAILVAGRGFGAFFFVLGGTRRNFDNILPMLGFPPPAIC